MQDAYMRDAYGGDERDPDNSEAFNKFVAKDNTMKNPAKTSATQEYWSRINMMKSQGKNLPGSQGEAFRPRGRDRARAPPQAQPQQ